MWCEDNTFIEKKKDEQYTKKELTLRGLITNGKQAIHFAKEFAPEFRECGEALLTSIMQLCPNKNALSLIFIARDW